MKNEPVADRQLREARSIKVDSPGLLDVFYDTHGRERRVISINSCPHFDFPLIQLSSPALGDLVPQNPTDEEVSTQDKLEHVRFIAGKNADIAMKAMGMLAECQQKLRDLVDAADKGIRLPHDQNNQDEFLLAVIASHELLAKQKEIKLYD